MEGDVASSDYFIVGLERGEKSQGGTCRFQIVSNIQITRTCNITKATGIILKRKKSLCQGISQHRERINIPSCCTYYTFSLVLPPDRIEFEINILRYKGKDFLNTVID